MRVTRLRQRARPLPAAGNEFHRPNCSRVVILWGMTAPPISRADVRPEIQALRAVAVAVVVVCHFWPSALPGGFVGVDVFFVDLRLPDHVAAAARGRRARAACRCRRSGRAARAGSCPRRCSCWLCCALATLVFVPLDPLAAVPRRDPGEHGLRRRTGSSPHTAVDYFAADDGPSPVQHFWSLSVEEQFYLVWPVLLAGRGRAARAPRAGASRHRRDRRAHRGQPRLLGLRHRGRTRRPPTSSRPTRAWEFGARRPARAAAGRALAGAPARRALLGRAGRDRRAPRSLYSAARRSPATRRCCRCSARWP